MSKEFVDWIIHYVANGAQCVECGKKEFSFLQYACNAHTHGMENYNHQDFQIVLNCSQEEIMRILNTLGLRVKAGERFKDGDYVKGIYEDCDVRLEAFEECGRTVLRVVIPDKYNRFPDDDACTGAYLLQTLQTDDLCVSPENRNPTIRIYQIPLNEKTRGLVFEGLESMQKETGGRIPAELYECVYEGKLNAETPEDVFTIFNTVYAEGYKGRSMSVSDVVEFKYSEAQDLFYYCDSVGFQQIHFKKKADEEAERKS